MPKQKSEFPALSKIVSTAAVIPGGIVTIGRTDTKPTPPPSKRKDKKSPSGVAESDEDKKPTYVEDCGPAHQRVIRQYKLSTVPITVEAWREYCIDTRRSMPSPPPWGWIDNHPMVNVSWIDIVGDGRSTGYLPWATSASKVNLRLPTEEEWEYCAREGALQNEFPIGRQFDHRLVWCSVNINRLTTQSVYSTAYNWKNRFGVAGLAGNVWQWCSSVYIGYPEPFGIARQLGGEFEGKAAVIRGGAFNTVNPDYFRSWYRNRLPKHEVRETIGFRVAID